MKASEVENIAVVGAGLMGQGIAQTFSQAGYSVTITDTSAPALNSVKERTERNLSLCVEEGLFDQKEATAIVKRITTVADLQKAVKNADFITEAVFENVDIKRKIFKEIEGYCPKHTILASNTSSIPMTQISSLLNNPERAIVTHYINPPHYVPLVEVIPGMKTSQETTDLACEVLRKIKKVPVVVKKELPGFLINRIQTAMHREIYALVEMGAASPEDIDLAVVTGMGFRLAFFGPLKVRDLAGLDVTCTVESQIVKEISSSIEAPKALTERVKRGECGFKSGKGFFTYNPEDAVKTIKERDKKFIRFLKEYY